MTATDLSPASKKLLREIARHDKGTGVQFRYVGRGRYSHSNTLAAYNQGTFRPLYRHGLVDDGGDDSAPVRVTEAGRKLAAELEAQEPEKKSRPKVNPDGPAALRLLAEIAKYDKPAPVYFDSRYRRFQRLGGHTGYRATVDTWAALERAGLISVQLLFAGGRRVTVTDAGRQRLAPARA